MAHTLAYLRFAGPISETVARLATGAGGLTRRRTSFAPAGRRTKFHEGIATSNPLRPAGPGRTAFPILKDSRTPTGKLSRLALPMASVARRATGTSTCRPPTTVVVRVGVSAAG